MKRKGISQYRLIQDGIVDTRTLDRLKKNENTTVVTLERICRALDCDISQVVKLEESSQAELTELEEENSDVRQTLENSSARLSSGPKNSVKTERNKK